CAIARHAPSIMKTTTPSIFFIAALLKIVETILTRITIADGTGPDSAGDDLLQRIIRRMPPDASPAYPSYNPRHGHQPAAARALSHRGREKSRNAELHPLGLLRLPCAAHHLAGQARVEVRFIPCA